MLVNILALTDASGQPLRQYHYQAFGFPEEYRADRQPFRFTGREWDKELGLYYYRARYYDPRAGRFISEDPIGFVGGLNLYRYADGNPVRFIDPLGLAGEAAVRRGPGEQDFLIGGGGGGWSAGGISEGTTIYRVWGGGSRPYGSSWTTVDPSTVPN